MRRGSAPGGKPPSGSAINLIAPNKSWASTLLENELDVGHVASPWVLRANALDRSSRIAGSGDWSKIRPLFPDRMAEATRFHKKHGFLPVNHAYIIRGDIYKKYPWVAFNLYTGFVKAKAAAREKLLEQIPHPLFFAAQYVSMTREMIGDDPFPYGMKANQAMLDMITSYSHEQGLTPRQMKTEELFAEQTLGL